MDSYPNELGELRQKYKAVSEHVEFLQSIIDAQEASIAQFKQIAEKAIAALERGCAELAVVHLNEH